MLTFPIYAFVGLDNPIVNSVYPAVGDVDGQHAGVITITGTNLQSVTGVTIGGVAATNVTASPTSITCKPGVYGGARGLVDLVLAAPSGNITLTNGFRYWTPQDLTDVGEAMETGRSLSHALGGAIRPTDDLVMEWTDMVGGVAQWSSDYSLNAVASDTDYCPLYVANATGSLPAVRIQAHPTDPDGTNYLVRYSDYGMGMVIAKYGFDPDTSGIRTGEDLTNGISCLYVAKWTSADNTEAQTAINVPLTGFGDTGGSIWHASGASAGKPALTYFTDSWNKYEFGSGGNNDGSIRVIATSLEPGNGSANTFIARGYEGPVLVGTNNTLVEATYTPVYSGPGSIGASYGVDDGWICDMFAAAITRSPVSTTDLDRWTQWSVLRFNTIPYV